MENTKFLQPGLFSTKDYKIIEDRHLVHLMTPETETTKDTLKDQIKVLGVKPKHSGLTEDLFVSFFTIFNIFNCN